MSRTTPGLSVKWRGFFYCSEILFLSSRISAHFIQILLNFDILFDVRYIGILGEEQDDEVSIRTRLLIPEREYLPTSFLNHPGV